MGDEHFKRNHELERLLVAREVDEQQDFATLIINSSVDGILTYDLEWRYTLWNPAAERLTGKRAEDVLGRRATDVFPHIRERGIDQCFEAALSGRSVVSGESPFLFPDGRDGFLQAFHSPLRDETGQIVGGLAIVRDVSERRYAIEHEKRLNADLERRIRERTLELETVVSTLQLEIQERQRGEANLRFLADAGERLSRSLDYDETLKSILELSTRHFEGWATLTLIRDGITFHQLTHHSEPEKAEMLEEIERQYPSPADNLETPRGVLKTGRPVWIPFITEPKLLAYAKDERHLHLLKGLRLKSYMAVPLIAREQVLGAVAFISCKRYYSSEDFQVAQDLGRRFSLAIDNARLFEEARRGERVTR